MADKKISALTASTLPLAGSEVLPIVQSGSTVKVSVANLTAGRDVATLTTSVPSGSLGGAFFNLPSGNASSRYWKAQNDVTAFGDFGLYQSTDNTGAAYTARLYFDAAGNPTASTGNFVVGTAGKGITTGGATALGLGVNNAVDAMTIDTSKNVGVGTTTPTSGSMSNSAIVSAGVFSTLRGSVASTSGVATTIATANQNHALATYIVSCGVSSGAPTAYSAVAIVSADNNTLRITNLQTATNMTISISGTDIQATQTSGGAANILFAVTRIA